MKAFIMQLAIDAGFEYDIRTCNFYPSTGYYREPEALDDKITKIVELTVRECIKIIRKEKIDDPDNIHFNMGIEYGVQSLYATTGVLAE